MLVPQQWDYHKNTEQKKVDSNKMHAASDMRRMRYNCKGKRVRYK